MQVHPVINPKGGVGKTNTVANLGAELSHLGYSVTIADLDARATLTYMLLGRRLQRREKGIAHVLLDEVDLADAIVDVPSFGVQLLPAEEIQMHLAKTMLKDHSADPHGVILERIVPHLKTDFLLLDTPGDFETLTIAAATAATGIIVPVLGSEGLHEVQGLEAKLALFRESRPASHYEIAAYVVQKFDGRERLSRELRDRLTEARGARYAGEIRKNSSLGDCFGSNLPARALNPRSIGTQDYEALARFIAAPLAAARLEVAHAS